MCIRDSPKTPVFGKWLRMEETKINDAYDDSLHCLLMGSTIPIQGKCKCASHLQNSAPTGQLDATHRMTNEDIAEQSCSDALIQFRANTLEDEKELPKTPRCSISKTQPIIPELNSLYLQLSHRAATIIKDSDADAEVPDESSNSESRCERSVDMDTIALRPRTEVVISLEKKLVNRLSAGCFRRENKRRIGEKYEMLEVVGKGAHGEIRKIRDRSTGDVRVAKIVPKESSSIASNFEEEIAILQKLVILLVMVGSPKRVKTIRILSRQRELLPGHRILQRRRLNEETRRGHLLPGDASRSHNGTSVFGRCILPQVQGCAQVKLRLMVGICNLRILCSLPTRFLPSRS
eukprot:TRINITY_DN9653_c0_g1_i8.p1 TRINITY_DN9653_c0_g1~~TRINITY_DN9653_c0_g1_i8.p1  ORF type:complete len:348 (+),score=28.59 TRINITY_DN9653_c0_g1_i8:74-1117(+)